VLNAMSLGVYRATRLFFELLIMLNIVLFLFNLIPLPPLDGYRIVEDLVPNDVRARLSRLEPYGAFVFLLIVFLPPLRDRTIVPLFALTNDLFNGMSRVALILLGQ
jgi:Zn-dependent protease